MDIGLVKDRRLFEHRIGLTPAAVRALTQAGHRVWVEDDAGIEAGFSNEDYREVGATIAWSEDEVLMRTQFVIRVSPPAASDYERFQPGQIILGSWHLAVAPEEGFRTLLDRKLTTVGIEIIEEDDGHAPGAGSDVRNCRSVGGDHRFRVVAQRVRGQGIADQWALRGFLRRPW